MPKRKPIDGDISEITQAMKQSQNCSEYRRIQCVYLAVRNPDISNKEISDITLFSKSRIKVIHANYRKGGLAELIDKRGGRHRENMTLQQEQELLIPFEQESKSGTLVVAGKIKQAYEQRVGHSVAESTIYRMLDRHGFRKITPYRRHKKADGKEQEAFKKLCKYSCRGA